MLLIVGLLAACSGEKDSPGTDTADSSDSDGGDSESNDSESNDSDSGESNQVMLVVTVQIYVEGMYAVNTDGGGQPMGGPFFSETIYNTPVDPGQWWIIAYETDAEEGSACNRSDVTELVAGDRFEWTVADFPGSYDRSDPNLYLCALP